MDINEYNKIKYFCKKNLKEYLQKELEDVTQYVALKYFESNYKANLKFLLIDYLRFNGLLGNNHKNNKKNSILSNAVQYDEIITSGPKIENDNNLNFIEKIDEVLSYLKLDKDVYKWAMKLQHQRMSLVQKKIK